jgi:hypothetical protein
LQTRERIASGLCLGVSGVVLAVLVLATVVRDVRVLTSSDPEILYPMAIYGIQRVPGSQPDRYARESAGADFSQVYTSAQALRHGESAYHPKTSAFLERFHREPVYPPLMNWLFVPISMLPFGKALILHSAVSICGLLAATLFLLWRTGLARQGWSVCLAIGSLYLLTPIGVTHLERGQFDLYVATAVLLCLSCFLLDGNHPFLAVGAGLMGAMKWTAPSFLVCFCLLGFLFADRPKRRLSVVIPAVMVAATVAFWPELKECWVAIRAYEIDATPVGITLQNFMPRWLARCAPLAITLAVAALIQISGSTRDDRTRVFESIGVPFALALINLSVCFGTVSYEYHTVSTLGMIPAVVVWTMKESRVSDRLKAITCGAFGIFLCVVFRLQLPLKDFGPAAMTAVYLATTLFFLGVCARIALAPIARSNDGRPLLGT